MGSPSLWSSRDYHWDRPTSHGRTICQRGKLISDLPTCWLIDILSKDRPFNQHCLQAHEERPQPSWGKVVMCISVFVVQYWLSGYLGNEMPNYQLLVFLGFIALAQWGIFDATLPGKARLYKTHGTHKFQVHHTEVLFMAASIIYSSLLPFM